MGTIQSRGFALKIFPKDHEPVHAHVEFDKGVLIIGFSDDEVTPLEIRGTVRAPDVKKALFAAAVVYDAVLAEWKKMQR